MATQKYDKAKQNVEICKAMGKRPKSKTSCHKDCNDTNTGRDKKTY